MKMTPKEYQEYVKNKQEKSPMGKDMLLSFLVGGGICVVGQLIQNGWMAIGLAKDDASTATAIFSPVCIPCALKARTATVLCMDLSLLFLKEIVHRLYDLCRL